MVTLSHIETNTHAGTQTTQIYSVSIFDKGEAGLSYVQCLSGLLSGFGISTEAVASLEKSQQNPEMFQLLEANL